MAALAWVICCGLLSLLIWLLVNFLVDFQRKRRCIARFPPLPHPAHWFWGHLARFKADEESMVEVNDYLHSNGYKCAGGWMGPTFAIINACHPDLAKQILKEPKLGRVYALLHPWLGKGLLTVEDGPRWLRNRRLLTPAFHYEILKGYVSVYSSCLQHLFQKWDECAVQNKPVLVFETISSMSLDIILQCAFSFKSNCQKESNRPPYIQGVLQLSDSVNERFFNPFYQIDWIFFLTPAGQRMRRACKIVQCTRRDGDKGKEGSLGPC